MGYLKTKVKFEDLISIIKDYELDFKSEKENFQSVRDTVSDMRATLGETNFFVIINGIETQEDEKYDAIFSKMKQDILKILQ